MHFVLQVAQILAMAFAGLGLLIGTGKCLETAERRGSNELCFYSLATILFDCLLTVGAVLGVRFLTQPVSMAIIAVAFFLISAVAVAAVALAFVGLVQLFLDRHQHQYHQGRLAGASALLLSMVASAGLGWLAWDTTREGVPASMVLYRRAGAQAVEAAAGNDPAPAAAEHADGPAAAEVVASTPPMDRAKANALLKQWNDWSRTVPWLNRESGYIYLDDQNVRYRTPGSNWVRMKPPDAGFELLTYRHAELPIHFELFAGPIDPGFLPSTASAAELIRQATRRTVSNAYVLSDRPVVIKDLKGRRLDLSFVMNGTPATQSCWVLIHNGSLYSMFVSGNSEHHSVVLSQATQLFGGFELLDQRAGAQAAARRAKSDFRSTRFPFEVALKGSLWLENTRGIDEYRGIRFRALNATEQATLDVMPMCLFDLNPHLAATARGFLSLFPGLPTALRSPENRTPITVGEMQGFEFTSTIKKRLWRTRVVQGNGYAYLIVASVAESNTNAEKLLSDAVDRVRFLEKFTPSVAGNSTFRQLHVYSSMMNQLGMYYFDARQQDTAVPYFLRALELEPENSIALSNAVEAYIASGRYADGCQLLEAHAEQLQSGKFRARYASMLARLKRDKDAIAAYSEAFADGYRDTAVFAEYLRLLHSTDQTERALEEADAYLQRADSQAVAIEKASLLAKAGRQNEAVALLDERQASIASSATLSYAMIEAYRQAGQSQKAMKLIDGLIADGHDSAQSWYVKHNVQCSLKRYEDAKTSLEKALEKSPADPIYKQALEHINTALGQGENFLVREEVPAVKLPPALEPAASASLPPAAISGAGAWYRFKAKAIEFRAGKEYRETTYRSVQVVDQTGVEQFSTINVSFFPKSQQAFVNELSVYDGQGKKVASGNVDSYYVVDDTDGDVASHRKLLRVPVPGLRPGYRLEMVSTVRSMYAYDRFPFETCPLSSSLPMARSVLYLHGDVADIVSQAPAGVATTKTEHELSWSLDHPASLRIEPLADAASQNLPTVHLNDRRSTWQTEVDEYLEMIQDRLKLPEQTRAQALQLVAGLDSDDAKVAALASYVQRSVTYKAIEFGRRARVMNSSDQTLVHCYGDCKDHSLLLVHLCEAAGIPANLALINASQDALADMPSLDQFNHEIVYLPNSGGGRFVDCTDKYNDLTMPVPYSLAGKQALVIERGKGRLVRVPECPPGINRLKSQRKVRVTPEGELVVSERVSCYGYWAGSMRATFKGLSSAGRKSMLAALTPGAGLLQVLDVKLENLDHTDAPLVLVIDYRLDQLFHLDGNHLLGLLPLMWEQRPLDVEYTSRRQAPFHLSSPSEFEVQTVLELPHGYALAPLDTSDSAGSGEFFRWKMHVTTTPGGATIDRQCGRAAGHFAAERYADFYREAQATRKALAPKLLIRRIGS